MNDSSRCYSCRCYSCRVRNAGIVNTYEGAAKPTAVSEISPGLFVHAGVMELRTRGNEGAIANVGFASEPMRLRRFKYVPNGAKRIRIEAKDTQGHVFQNEWKVDGSGI
jgi:hypothetical protein